MYAMKVLDHEWPEAEPFIKKDTGVYRLYKIWLGSNPDSVLALPKMEDAINKIAKEVMTDLGTESKAWADPTITEDSIYDYVSESSMTYFEWLIIAIMDTEYGDEHTTALAGYIFDLYADGKSADENGLVDLYFKTLEKIADKCKELANIK